MITSKHSIFAVDSHTAGHPTRIVVGGVPKVPLAPVAQQRDYIKDNLDFIRTMLVHEPRGHTSMYGAILTRPSTPEVDFGMVFYGDRGYDDMCGHGTIGVSTVLIETDMVPVKEPITEITLEAPAGVIRVKVEVEKGKVNGVTLTNVPAFLFKKDMVIDVPGYGQVKGDIGFGGNWFFYTEAKALGLTVRPEKVDDLIAAGSAIKVAINQKMDLVHPNNPNVSKKLLGVSFIDAPYKVKNAHQKNVVVEDTCVDRSPCGTGTCGRMAVLYGHKKLGLNEEFRNESITGTLFRGKLIGEAKAGDLPAVIPQVTGNAYITGYNHFVLDPDDPFGTSGFLLGQEI